MELAVEIERFRLTLGGADAVPKAADLLDLYGRRREVAGVRRQPIIELAMEGPVRLFSRAPTDRVAAEFEAMGELLNARADDIVRTTEPRNDRAAQAIWERMAANGDIYLSKYSGWYSVLDEAYFDESELSDSPDGKKLAPSGAPVEWVEEESYFFKLSAYAERLLAHYEAHPEFITPEAYRNEIVAFVKRGLADLSISRATFKWGTPVPGDPRHVMYVWVDALTNYITATGFPDEGPRAKFWPADAHVIGKDITRFHAIYWPAFLMSAGLPVPRQIVVHGFLFNRGEKMSKSVGNVVPADDVADKYGADSARLAILLGTDVARAEISAAPGDPEAAFGAAGVETSKMKKPARAFLPLSPASRSEFT